MKYADSKNLVCICDPGTAESGWHETRGEACVRADLSAWTQLIAATYRRLRTDVAAEASGGGA